MAEFWAILLASWAGILLGLNIIFILRLNKDNKENHDDDKK